MTTTITSTTPILRVKQYKNIRLFEADAAKMMSQGWHLEGQSQEPGNLGLGGAAAGALLAGPMGVIAASGMSRKGKITVTWVKDTPTALDLREQQARLAGKKMLAHPDKRRPGQAIAWVIGALLLLVATIATIPTVIGAVFFGILTLACFVNASRAARGVIPLN